jgi:serine/threonine-protein kinase RsbT
MPTTHERLTIATSADVVLVRNAVRIAAESLGFRHLEITKVVTAASEIARNTLVYGGGGSAEIEILSGLARAGVRMIFSDDGPGIPDLALALREGYTTGGGMGLGLSGAKKLVDEFAIDSQIARGTRVTLIKWK